MTNCTLCTSLNHCAPVIGRVKWQGNGSRHKLMLPLGYMLLPCGLAGYHLLQRVNFETDLAETCRRHNVSLLAYSPLAGACRPDSGTVRDVLVSITKPSHKLRTRPIAHART